jgi:type IV pilus assembly protein PilB
MADPLNLDALDALQSLARRRIDIVVAGETDLQRALDAYYPVRTLPQPDEVEVQVNGSFAEDWPSEPAGEEDATAVKLTEQIIAEAVRSRASDVHIEPQDHDLRIRLRIDGLLEDYLRVAPEHGPTVLSRLKALAGLDIAERRLPQDGRVRLSVGNDDVEFRISTLPTRLGEKIVLRVFQRDMSLLNLERLGFTPDNLAMVRRALGEANGIVLATGPTGSG